jgi:hypothetical protein
MATWGILLSYPSFFGHDRPLAYLGRDTARSWPDGLPLGVLCIAKAMTGQYVGQYHMSIILWKSAVYKTANDCAFPKSLPSSAMRTLLRGGRTTDSVQIGIRNPYH